MRIIRPTRRRLLATGAATTLLTAAGGIARRISAARTGRRLAGSSDSVDAASGRRAPDTTRSA